jgi:Stage II sporulation protein E (SpoIIE)
LWLPLFACHAATFTVYDDLVFHLQEGETLTLYTDGILEARNARGELYGFERLAELLGRKPSVEQIVETACSFGPGRYYCALRRPHRSQSA